MLSNTPGINRSTSWSEVKSKVSSDPRYTAVASDSCREDLFKTYLKTLKEDTPDVIRSKEEEKLPSFTSKKKDERGEGHPAIEDFRNFLAEKVTDSEGSFESFKSKFYRNPRWTDELTAVQKKRLFESRVREVKKKLLESQATCDNTRDKEEQSQSLHSPSVSENNESSTSQKEAAVENFTKFIAEKVTDSEGSFKSFKSRFDTDLKWTKELTDAEKRKLFDSHVDEIHRKNRELLWSILDEIELSLATTWDSVKDKVQGDSRFISYTDSEKKQAKEYAVYMHKKYLKAKEDFRELLKETQLFTFKTKEILEQGSFSLKDFEDAMQNDKRFTALTCISDQRDQMILAYINELSEKTQPPD
ncbi:unnamed protein product [Candidula unifasciata]|uniref:FF domain-containing protein n=1 Tax=Candidula unifasciata TaxID=100452 RepID=A0A8S3ZRA6_9EUPU|nr:unnamed protein product [Candidula unifasciata]